jgi:hypothetical protein
MIALVIASNPSAPVRNAPPPNDERPAGGDHGDDQDQPNGALQRSRARGST